MDTDVAHALVRFGLGRRGGEPLPDRSRAPGPGHSSAVRIPCGWPIPRPRPPDWRRCARTGEKRPHAGRVARAGAVPPGCRGATGQCARPRRRRSASGWSGSGPTISPSRCAAASARALAGAFVEEAIRPHVTGRFADMLLAVMRHPAMLLYLDNVSSAGPDSPAGQRGKRGLNENLARECLELHTVSPAAGYTQADVTSFARDADRLVDRPASAIRPASGSARSRTSRASRSSWAGASRPARKVAWPRCAFWRPIPRRIAFWPPSWCGISSPTIRRRMRCAGIAGVLRDSDGDLGAAAAALTTLEAAWQPQTKLRTPLDLPGRHAARAGGAGAAAGTAISGRPLSPRLASRSGPRRSRTAGRTAPPTGPDPRRCCAGSTGPTPSPAGSASRDPAEVAEASLGPLLRPATLKAMRRCGLAARRADAAAHLSGIPEAMMLHLTRRSALLGLASAFTLGRASLALADAPTDRRFVVVILRGALDGLSAVVPYGDRGARRPARRIVPPAPGQDGGVLDLGGFYGLHPALANLHAMYRAGEALAVHAVAGPYRVRSHFEAQDYLESGADHRMTSGWLNRAVAALPRTRASTARRWRSACRCRCCCAVRPAVANWAPHGTAALDADLYARIAALNHDDRVLGPGDRRGPERARLQRRRIERRRTGAEPLCLSRPRQGRRRNAGCRGRPTYRRTGDRRLGYPCGSATAPRRRAAPTRRRAGGAEDRARRGMAADGGADHDRVRPDRADERHAAAPTMEPALSRSSWEARCPADASWRTGLDSVPAGCSRIATCSRRWTCGQWPRGCSPRTSASASRRWVLRSRTAPWSSRCADWSGQSTEGYGSGRDRLPA